MDKSSAQRISDSIFSGLSHNLQREALNRDLYAVNWIIFMKLYETGRKTKNSVGCSLKWVPSAPKTNPN